MVSTLTPFADMAMAVDSFADGMPVDGVWWHGGTPS